MEPATRIVLASASPRRRRLLSWLGLPFEVDAFDTPESLDTPLAADPEALAISLAEEKAAAALAAGAGDDALVLTFDTIVVLDGGVLGKPADEADAWRMLRSLSGRTHQVVTGCTIARPGEALHSFAVVTAVQMQALTDCRIEAWMAMGEFMGCAGAYNIEGQVAEVTDSECYQNVAGLPLCHVFVELKRLSSEGLVLDARAPLATCDAALCRSCRLGPVVTRMRQGPNARS